MTRSKLNAIYSQQLKTQSSNQKMKIKPCQTVRIKTKKITRKIIYRSTSVNVNDKHHKRGPYTEMGCSKRIICIRMQVELCSYTIVFPKFQPLMSEALLQNSQKDLLCKIYYNTAYSNNTSVYILICASYNFKIVFRVNSFD